MIADTVTANAFFVTAWIRTIAIIEVLFFLTFHFLFLFTKSVIR